MEAKMRIVCVLLGCTLAASAQQATNKVSMIEYPVPTAASIPSTITTGPDGALWFTEQHGPNIGRITTAGVITEFLVPTPRSDPYGLTFGPDGALWFTEYSGNKIGRITTAGVITEFPVPTVASQPYGLTFGPDGALGRYAHLAGPGFR